MNNNNLADQLQVWGFEDDYIIFSDGSLGFGFELIPLEVSCWEDERINQLAQRIAPILNGLPSEIDIQFIQDISKGNEAILEQHLSLIASGIDNTAKVLCERRVDNYTKLDKQGLIPRHTLKIFVRRQLSKPLVGKAGFLSKRKDFPKISTQALSSEISAAKRVRDDLEQSLRSLGLNPSQLKAESIMHLMYWQWNPTRSDALHRYDPDDIRTSILFTDSLIDEKGFFLSDMHHRVLSLKLLPEQTFASMARCLRELPFDSRLFLSIHVPDQQKELTSLQTQRRLAFSMARGKQSGVSDIESETKLQDLETLLQEMIAQGEKVFHVSLNILLRSQDKDVLDAQVSEALAKVRELSGAEAMEESLAAFDIFAEFSIPNARAKERMKRMKTSTLCDLLPIYGPWVGNKVPSILLRSRMGSLVSFDPFSPDFTNYNHVVSGGSGSGKSFLTNILLLQAYKENPKIFIVDIGGSYKKLCENVDGQYVPLDVGSGFSINPFDLLPDENVPTSQKIKFLVSLIELMTKENSTNGLSRLVRAGLEESIQRVYETTNTPSITALREILLSREEPEIKAIGKILSQWCGNTVFGNFVDRPTTIALHRPIVSFDLKGMENYPDLQAVCLFIITDFVWREVQRDRSTKKFLVFDECWRLLENESGSVFIAEVFRTFRKYFSSAIAISQNIDDFAKSKVATAILSNSSIKWILMQKGADQQRLKEVLQLNENEMMLIESLRQERGLFSEAFLIAGDQRSVVAVESTSLEYWIATTDPRDLAILDEERKKHPDLEHLDVLENLARRYPHGFAANIKEAGNTG